MSKLCIGDFFGLLLIDMSVEVGSLRMHQFSQAAYLWLDELLLLDSGNYPRNLANLHRFSSKCWCSFKGLILVISVRQNASFFPIWLTEVTFNDCWVKIVGGEQAQQASRRTHWIPLASMHQSTVSGIASEFAWSREESNECCLQRAAAITGNQDGAIAQINELIEMPISYCISMSVFSPCFEEDTSPPMSSFSKPGNDAGARICFSAKNQSPNWIGSLLTCMFYWFVWTLAYGLLN